MTQTLIQQPQDSELLIYNLDFNKSNITRALEITADYVAKFKLILTGGTAIDMALRSKEHLFTMTWHCLIMISYQMLI